MKTKILILIVCSINCFTGNVGATEQTGERLMVGDKAFGMQVLPLEQDSVLARLLHKRLSSLLSRFNTALSAVVKRQLYGFVPVKALNSDIRSICYETIYLY